MKEQAKLLCDTCGGPKHAKIVFRRRKTDVCKTCYMRVKRGGTLDGTAEALRSERVAKRELVMVWHRKGLSRVDVAKRTGIPLRSVYRYVRESEE